MSPKRYFILSVLILISLTLLFSCGGGLNEVEGFSGKIFLPQDSTGKIIPFPDSLEAAVVVVAEYKLYTSVDSFLTAMITYSEPLDTASTVTDYFVQTLPGVYLAGVVAIKVPISQLLFMSPDSIAAHPEFFVPLGIYHKSGFPLNGIEVRENQITSGIDIQLDYSFQLPFKR